MGAGVDPAAAVGPAAGVGPGSGGTPARRAESAAVAARAAFFHRPVLDVARDLLGATVRHGAVAVRLTEVEAYGGTDDPASHAWRGPTPRSEVMFGPPGRAYVYFIYGMHWCLNLVCGPPGEAAAVLLRAGEVCGGLSDARGRAPRLADRDLARGPGRLARALGVDGVLDGADVTGTGRLAVLLPSRPAAGTVSSGARVGVSRGADLPWRLWLDGEPTVSRAGDQRAGGRRAGGVERPMARRMIVP